MPAARSEERVLIIAPIGQDAASMAAIFEAEGIATAICSGPGECLEQMESGAGALLVTEEALEMGHAADLLQALETQPPWSELPLIVLTSGGESRLAQLLELAASAAGSVTLLERPMSAVTLLRSVQVALRSRRRQYQVREFQTQLEGLVAERTAKLNELVGELEHFSYTITHDMRAPLRSMRGFAELVEQLCTACPHTEHKGLLRRVITSAERMDLLITDALSYSKAVRQDLPLGPIDVTALLRGMLDSYPELQTANAHIRIQGGIPLVLGNQAGLTQCFSNLLGNAVKFAKPGQIPEVLIRGEMVPGSAPAQGQSNASHSQPSQRVRIWVEDNGIGIAETMLPRIFNLFARGSTDQEGTGIGLALVRKVIDRMGGRVGVESKAGQGSRFWLELLPGDRRQPISAPPPSPPLGPGRIL